MSDSSTLTPVTEKDRRLYETPPLLTRAMLKLLRDRYFSPVANLHALEPCAGKGAICRELDQDYYTVTAWEIEERHRSDLLRVADYVHIGDARQMDVGLKPDLIITNPPFALACEIWNALWPLAVNCGAPLIMLNRMAWLSSSARAEFWRQYGPLTTILPVSPRPSFVPSGKADFSEYAWFIGWPEGIPGNWPAIDPLVWAE